MEDTPQDATLAQTAVSLDVYNPYAFKIDLSSSEGRKVYARSTKGLDDDEKYDMSVEDAENFFDAAVQASEEFCWGDVVENIEINWDSQGNLKETKNMFEDQSDLTFSEVEDAAKLRWGDGYSNIILTNSVSEAIHQSRLQAAMIAKWVFNSLTVDGKRELMLEEEGFTFTYSGSSRKERDGPTMLKIIFDKVNPNTTVGVMKHKKYLQNTHIKDHEGCVTKLLDNMAFHYKKSLERKQSHDDYLMHLFDALETVENTKFRSFIENERRAYETNRCGSNYGPKDLIRATREVYNNLVDQEAYCHSART